MVHMNSRAQKNKKPKMWCRLLAGIITLLYLGIVVSIVIMYFAPREWKVINASQGHFIGLNNSMPPLLWLCVGFFAHFHILSRTQSPAKQGRGLTPKPLSASGEADWV